MKGLINISKPSKGSDPEDATAYGKPKARSECEINSIRGMYCAAVTPKAISTVMTPVTTTFPA